MAILSPSSRRAVPHAIAILLASLTAAHAQTTLQPVTVTGAASPPMADVTGFGVVPLKDVPASVSVIDRRAIEASGARRLADLTRFDPSVADAYNAPGYWDFLTIRGFTLDSKYNYRREGMPISAETSIPLDNKERIEILKGTSGIQAGTSAPGGLVNYVVKRPLESDRREARVEFSQRSSILAAADISQRFGADRAFGLRINAAHETLRPRIEHLDGERSLLAAAADWRLGGGAKLEAELEWSRKRQPSQTAFSLQGNVLPAVPDPRLNLNNQPWVQPTTFEGTTGTVRFSQPLGRDWKWALQLGTQQLRTDDYTAFPYGCSGEGNYDRFCSDGSFDYYDYRSEGEKRRTGAARIALQGKAATGSISHDQSFSLLHSKSRDRLPRNAYNWVGTGTLAGTSIVPPDPTLTYEGSLRDERSLEFSAQDAMRLTSQLTGWLGVRHTRLDRSSVQTDGSGATTYSQGVTTPWAALSYKLMPETTVYASWGQGVESQVVPNNPNYANPGAVLPVLKSRQWEAGVKSAAGPFAWQLAAFDIRRPMSNVDYCNSHYLSCTGQFDGQARHRGIEAAAQWTQGALRLGGSAMWLHARRDGSALSPTLNGLHPQNVPAFVARANAGWRIAPGLELSGHVSHEGSRAVSEDNTTMLPAWTRLDAALRYETRMGNADTAWTVGIDNLGGKRYWKEAPFKFGHLYLYPGAPRTLRVGLNAAF